ncbi:MAG: PorT family protein [Bacteroidetes bacterium]|nr:PorT family protein [Bacteroidota bacterium]
MKQKNIFLTAAFLILFFSLHAQFRAGVGLCGVSSDIKGADFLDGDNDFNKAGFSAGLILNSFIDEQNSFQFELNYITKGTMQKSDSANNHYFKLALDYVEVPFVYRHRMDFVLNKKERKNFEIEFGASVGRLVKIRDIYNNYYQTYNTDQFHYTDVSILLGLNYHISEHFYAGLRYSNSVIPVMDKNKALFARRFTINNGNNMVYQLGVHYVFGNPNKAKEHDGSEGDSGNQ